VRYHDAVGIAFPDSPEHRDAVDVGQVAVERHEVRSRVISLERIEPVLRFDDVVPLKPQPFGR
jgi:hypothetical protein